MSQINIRNLSNENEDGAPDIVGVSTFSATSYMVPPVGTTAQRPENPQPGDLRFNTDTASLEYFKGNTIGWSEIEMTSPDLNGGARAVYGGGYSPQHPTIVNTIGYLTIATLGSALDFGDMTSHYMQAGACSSRTRGIIAGGRTPSFVNDIEYITLSSTGNGTDFGGNLLTMYTPGGCSDQTRGIFGNGYVPSSPHYVNSIDYITIASTGQNANDFGDLSVARGYGHWCSSSTRGLSMGGYNGTAALDTIDYVTIATTGNAADFGDMTVARSNHASSITNAVRMVMPGGVVAPGGSHNVTIDYITMATLGNAQDFGDQSGGSEASASGSSPTRGVYFIGAPTTGNTLEYIQIMTTGNGIDFGDLNAARRVYSACSNGHGGLG